MMIISEVMDRICYAAEHASFAACSVKDASTGQAEPECDSASESDPDSSDEEHSSMHISGERTWMDHLSKGSQHH